MSLRTVLCPLLLLLVSCGNDVTTSVIPEYNVQFSCNSTLINAVAQQTKQTSLDCLGGYVRIYDKNILHTSDVIGAGGLLILQNFEGVFYAFDLACPYCYKEGKGISKISRIEIKDDALTAACPSCSSEYGAVVWGSPAATKGKANEENLILRQYRAQRLGDGVTVVVSR
ncbi:MAG: hypothetical protein HUJ97_04215 [Bacteroidales bacterium]|nr:hypothetical protein [Bacteroidales bacterium]